MIKTLRITSVVAGALAVIFLIVLVFFGTGSNKQVEEFLKSEGIIEKFNKAENSATKTSRSQTSPLVIQAIKIVVIFILYFIAFALGLLILIGG